MLDEEMLMRAAGMKRAGMKMADIAARCGCNAKSLENALRRIGAKSKLDGKGGRRKALTVRGPLSNKWAIND